MAKLYFQNGKIISRSGNLGTSEGCCCGGGPCTGPCGGWSYYANQYSLTVNTSLGNVVMPPGGAFGSEWINGNWFAQYVCTPWMDCNGNLTNSSSYINISNFVIGLPAYFDGPLGTASSSICNQPGNLNGITVTLIDCFGGVTGSVTFNQV